MNGLQPQVMHPAGGHIAENPLLRSSVCNPEVEAAAVAIHARLFGLLNLDCREPIECPHDCPPFLSAHISQALYRPTGADKSRRVSQGKCRYLRGIQDASRYGQTVIWPGVLAPSSAPLSLPREG